MNFELIDLGKKKYVFISGALEIKIWIRLPKLKRSISSTPGK